MRSRRLRSSRARLSLSGTYSSYCSSVSAIKAARPSTSSSARRFVPPTRLHSKAHMLQCAVVLHGRPLHATHLPVAAMAVCRGPAVRHLLLHQLPHENTNPLHSTNFARKGKQVLCLGGVELPPLSARYKLDFGLTSCLGVSFFILRKTNLSRLNSNKASEGSRAVE